MKVLHILPSPRAEGTPRIVLDWVQVKNEIEQDLVFLEPRGELRSQFESLPNWQFYNEEFPIGIRSVLKMIFFSARLVKERNPDLMICWNAGFSPWIILGARIGGLRNIITHAGNFAGYFRNWNSWIHTNISGWMHFFCGGKIICCSQYVLNSYKSMPGTPKSVYKYVYNCFSFAKFHSEKIWKDRRIDFIMVATLENHKDHLTLLKTWKLLENMNLSYSLKVVGNGTQKDNLINFMKTTEIKHVEFLGSRSDVPSLLSDSKVFVFSTTEEEGFGTVLLEALASGCKIIASDVPACREVLRSGKFGHLVGPKDPLAMVNAIKSINWESEDANISSEISDYLSSFEPSSMMKKYFEIVGISI